MKMNQLPLVSRAGPPPLDALIHWPRVARASRALKFAAAITGAGAGLIPLGDNSKELAELRVRVRAARGLCE